MRGSVSKVARSGGGKTWLVSQVIGTRFSGSWARTSWRMLVPVRGSPSTKIGARISAFVISG